MKVSEKLAVGYGLIMALLVVLLAYHVSTVEANAEEGRRLSALTSRLLLSATDQRYWLDQMDESATKYRILGDSGYVRKFEDYARRYEGALTTFEAAPLTATEERELSQLKSTWRAFRGALLAGQEEGSALGRPGLPEPGGDAPLGGIAALNGASLDSWFQRLRDRTDELVDATRSAMEGRVRTAERRAYRAEVVAWLGGGGALLVSAAVWFLVVRRLAGGLTSLTAATRTVADGEFDHRLDAEGEDEFAQLARDFNAMTERLAELDELKRDFISRVSHDLKSPLASMQEANQLLLDGVAGGLSDEQRRFLELSRDNGRRLQAMISKLLDLARLDADVQSTQLEPHDLREPADATVERMRPSFRQGGAELEARTPGAPVPVLCDREQIEQVLENLLENARRFTSGGGRTEVRLDVVPQGSDSVPEQRWRELDANGSDRVARLTVADDGPGVAEADRDRIFDRFQHGDDASDSSVGLGLTLCREVADAHGGVIWVEDAPSGGAAFVVLLPLRSDDDGGGGAPAAGDGSDG